MDQAGRHARDRTHQLHHSTESKGTKVCTSPSPEPLARRTEGDPSTDATRAVAMASLLSPNSTVAATSARPTARRGRLAPSVTAMATKGPKPSSGGTKRSSGTTTVFPVGKPAGPPRPATTKGSAPVKLLTNVEKLRLLTKAEKAGLLSAAERAGLSLSKVEQLGLLSKAEELGVLSAATDPGTPGSLQGLALLLLAAGPAVVFLVPEQYPWEVALQAVAALVCVAGGSAAFAASSFVSRLQGSSG